jgi:hypothetical protein
MLKEIAPVIDPMGLYSPVLVRGKVLLHELWKFQDDWNDPIENESIL